MGQISKSQQLQVSRDVFSEMHKGFSFVKKAPVSPAQGFRELHDAVRSAFAHVDLQTGARNEAHDLINCLHNLYEQLAEQESINPKSQGYFIEREDLQHLVENMAALGEAIRIHQTDLKHHETATALLWSKSALKKIVAKP